MFPKTDHWWYREWLKWNELGCIGLFEWAVGTPPGVREGTMIVSTTIGDGLPVKVAHIGKHEDGLGALTVGTKKPYCLGNPSTSLIQVCGD